MIQVTVFCYDVHTYGSGRPMVMGGLPIQGGPEVVAHSEGDVVHHALTDALLGCMGGGDIGQRFPDNDPRFEGMESSFFLREVLEDVRRAGIEIVHA
ncbi:2-C-methyl-D-erythritol 2,4-cyclodiphosphate synthase, partial [Oceanidesulfovibrio marinus]